MPATLKRRLAAEVASRDSALNDVIGEILADRFGAPFEPSGRRGSRPGDSGVVLLRIPPALKQRIRASGAGPRLEHQSRHRRGARRSPRSGARRTSVIALRPGSEGEGERQWHPRTAAGTAPRALRTRCASPSSASATARTRSSRASTTTAMRTTSSSSPGSCTSTSAATTSGTSRSRPRSTSSRARSGSTSPTRCGPTRTTRSGSPTCRSSASRCTAG